MGIAESYKKNREKGSTTPPMPPAPETTLAEILKNKNKSHVFGKLLEREGQAELAVRLAKGELEEDDLDVLEQQRLLFTEKMAHSDRIERMLTPETVAEFARNHPDFAKIINILGPEKAVKIIQGQLKELSITDESRFDRIANSMDQLEAFKTGDYKAVNDRIEKLCKDKKITPKEFLDAIALQDPTAKEKALRDLSHRTHGLFKRVLNKLSRGNYGKNITLQDLKDGEDSLETSLQDLNTSHGVVGSELFSTIKENEDMRKALSKELAMDKTPAEQRGGFIDAKKESSEMDEAAFKKAWEAYKKQAGYAGADATDQDIIKDLFIEKQQEDYRKKKPTGGGFWSSIFSSLFEEKIKNKKNTLN
jgi:hypothetical protein